MAFKNTYVIYQGRNGKADIADVKAQVYFNGSTTPTFSNIAATILGGGDYLITLTAAQAAVNGQGDYKFVIDSASTPAQAVVTRQIDSASLTDLDAHLTAQDSSIAALQTSANTANTNITSIKGDLETGPNSLATLSSLITTVQGAVSSLSNNSSFSAYGLGGGFVIPASGSQLYQIPVNFSNSDGAAIDPDNGACTVDLVNLSGQDFGSYLTGYTAGTGGNPGTAPLVKKALGKWYINLTIPSNATPAQYNADFSYSLNGKPENKTVTITLLNNVQADGFASQLSVNALQSDVTTVKNTAADTNTTAHSSNTLLNDSTFGLAAAQVLQAAIKAQTDKIGDGTIGLAALQTNQQTILSYLAANVYSGGRAV